MSNYYFHAKTKKLTFEYAQLNQKVLRIYFHQPSIKERKITWTDRWLNKITVKIKRTPESLFIYTHNDSGYYIFFDETDLTFGKRNWFLCPICDRRAGILYLDTIFACRHCVKPAYKSQNGSQFSYLGTKIISLRAKLWGEKYKYLNELGMRSWYWPKPHHIHWKRYERERFKIMLLENKRTEIWLAEVYREFPYQR